MRKHKIYLCLLSTSIRGLFAGPGDSDECGTVTALRSTQSSREENCVHKRVPPSRERGRKGHGTLKQVKM